MSFLFSYCLKHEVKAGDRVLATFDIAILYSILNQQKSRTFMPDFCYLYDISLARPRSQEIDGIGHDLSAES